MRTRARVTFLLLLRRLMLLAAFLAGVGAPAAAQEPQVLQAAVMQFARAGAALPALPPPQTLRIGSSCSWCSSSFLGICFKTDGESWQQTLDMTWQTQLDQALAQSGEVERRVAEGAGAARAWMAALPAFSARFDAAADIVLGVQAEIVNATPSLDQRTRALQGLQQLVAGVSASAAQLENASRMLAAALQDQSNYRTGINAALAASQQQGQAALAAFENGARTHRCQDGVAQQLDAVRGAVNATQAQARAIVDQVSAQSSGTEKSVATLLGAMVSARTQLESVLRLVQAASNDQLGSFLAQLHLDAAKRQWQDLAATQAQAMPRLQAQGAP